jgi:hypothetical protein
LSLITSASVVIYNHPLLMIQWNVGTSHINMPSCSCLVYTVAEIQRAGPNLRYQSCAEEHEPMRRQSNSAVCFCEFGALGSRGQ